jgi:hypothetical protein
MHTLSLLDCKRGVAPHATLAKDAALLGFAARRRLPPPARGVAARGQRRSPARSCRLPSRHFASDRDEGGVGMASARRFATAQGCALRHRLPRVFPNASRLQIIG